MASCRRDYILEIWSRFWRCSIAWWTAGGAPASIQRYSDWIIIVFHQHWGVLRDKDGQNVWFFLKSSLQWLSFITCCSQWIICCSSTFIRPSLLFISFPSSSDLLLPFCLLVILYSFFLSVDQVEKMSKLGFFLNLKHLHASILHYPGSGFPLPAHEYWGVFQRSGTQPAGRCQNWKVVPVISRQTWPAELILQQRFARLENQIKSFGSRGLISERTFSILPNCPVYISIFNTNPLLVRAKKCAFLLRPDSFVSMETGPQIEGVACEVLNENKPLWSKE